MTETEAIWFRNFYMDTLKHESELTARVLEAVPAEGLSYRPDPASRPAIDLLRHIAAADNRFVETAINGVFSVASLIPEDKKQPREIATWYRERHAANRAALAAVSGADLVRMVDFRGMFTRPAVSYLVMGLHHTIHHRGQLSASIRAMGGKVPSIYGESYDAAVARGAEPRQGT
jgi:uncharacterized damage-inducible protein DinB